jgi:hypothetical protein
MIRVPKQLISLDTTTYYHSIRHVVRCAFLWGEDSLTGKNYEHRRTWFIAARMRELAHVFARERWDNHFFISCNKIKIVGVLVSPLYPP